MSSRNPSEIPQFRITRRSTLLAGGGALLAADHLQALTGEPSPVAETEYGRVRGASVEGVHIFRGIPYGGPTEGSKRFLPPSKPAAWTGVRDATVTGPRCVQGPGNIFLSATIGEYFAGGRPDRVELSRQVDSEDCLNVNVLTPGLGGRRPVMVYIHGGGLTGGSSALTLFSDRFVREQDVVLVGVNHRLNVFGYLYLGGNSPKYSTGNAGQLDLIRALEWVRGNIAHFGGNPANVTVFGESGGGAKISALLAMPAAKGLFHKACVQSGSVLRASDPDQATAEARKLLLRLDVSEKDVDQLQNVPTDKLFAASRAAGFNAMIVVDGHSLPHQTWDPKAPEESATVPMIVGNDKDESRLFSFKDPALFHLDEAALRARVIKAGIAESDVDALLALYRRDHPSDSPTDLYFRISSDRGARHNAARQAELKVEQGRAPVYVYYGQWNTPLAEGDMKIKAFHTSDLPLTMRLVRFPESEELSRQLSGAWAAFARTGNPGQKGLPWPAYTLERRTTMIFDAPKSGAADDPDRDERVMLRDRPSGKSL
jgi:para-nitrobenzyl esterase